MVTVTLMVKPPGRRRPGSRAQPGATVTVTTVTVRPGGRRPPMPVGPAT